MHKTLLSGAASFSLAALAVVATFAATANYSEFRAVPSQDQIRTDQARSGPPILAQGRCYNGRCY